MSELAVIQEDRPSSSVLAVISRAATDASVDVDKMERLLAMQERVMAKDAEMAFYSDMAELQNEMPAIRKEGQIKVGQDVRSRYAKFEHILEATQPLLQKYGFSVSFKSNFIDGQLEISGTLSHRAGHHESTTMRLPFDDSGSKNKVQAIGSSVSYGKRYVYCMLLNVNIADQDDDGVSADANNTPERMLEYLMRHNDALRDNLPSVLCIKESLAIGEWSTAKEAWLELDPDERRALWMAPSKGGVFTTKERAQMKSDEFNAA